MNMNLPANKLVFVGGMGAGKTTAVRAISDIEPVSTEMPLSEDAQADKFETTVALDYSSIELDDGELLQESSLIAPQASLAVGITRTDQHGDVLVPQFRQALYAAGFRLPVMRVDARDADQVTFLARSLLSYRYTQQH